MDVLISLYSVLMVLVNLILTLHWYQMHRQVMSPVLQRVYKYGKTLDSSKGAADKEETSILTKVTVPKSSFRLFYVSAIILNISCFLFADELKPLIFLLFWKSGVTFTCHAHYLLVWFLELVQVLRRCYECCVVSVYSPSSRINVFHLVSGFGFYAGVALIITDFGYLEKESQSFSFICTAIGLGLFVWGSSIQWQSHQILAGLRRRTRPDGKKLVVTYEHMIPYGHWFEVISNPHYFAEIVIYAGILMMSKFEFTFLILFWYVVVSHMVMGEQSHNWYTDKFKELYPQRKVLIPGLY